MPIYEFFCADCNTVFNFFSSRVNTEKRPDCPCCGRPQLKRMPSLFAAIGKLGDDSDADSRADDLLAGLDSSKMEAAMANMLTAAEKVDENDPRQMAAFMRRFADTSGMPLNDCMNEALSRMESGDDLEQIEADLGNSLDSDMPFDLDGIKKKVRSVSQPRRDDHLYEL